MDNMHCVGVCTSKQDAGSLMLVFMYSRLSAVAACVRPWFRLASRVALGWNGNGRTGVQPVHTQARLFLIRILSYPCGFWPLQIVLLSSLKFYRA